VEVAFFAEKRFVIVISRCHKNRLTTIWHGDITVNSSLNDWLFAFPRAGITPRGEQKDLGPMK
jgi:hypothetical protein